jgi:hypothetical protein
MGRSTCTWTDLEFDQVMMLSNIDERFVQRNERTNVGCRDELVLGLWLGD